MPIIANAKHTKATVRVNNGSQTINLADVQLAGETVEGLQVAKILWSGTVTIARGANTHFSLTGNGVWDFDSAGISSREDQTASVVITATTASCVVLLKKVETLVGV